MSSMSGVCGETTECGITAISGNSKDTAYTAYTGR